MLLQELLKPIGIRVASADERPVQSRNQQVLIRQGGRIVAHHSRQAANQRSHQVIDDHWAGLVPQRSIDADDPTKISDLATCRWVAKGDNVMLLCTLVKSKQQWTMELHWRSTAIQDW